MLEILEALKKEIEAELKKGNCFIFLCNICEYLTWRGELEVGDTALFREYLYNNYPETFIGDKEEFKKNEGVVFDEDEERINWLNENIEKLKK